MLQTGISSPEPRSERTPLHFDVRPPAVEAWVANLPLADVSKTCGMVFNALAESNTRELAPSQRYKLLELLRTPVHYLTDALTRHFTNAALPLPPQTTRIAGLLHGLQLEIAKGYQRIVEDLLALDGLRQDFSLLAAALQRGLVYYGQALLTGFQVYRPAAPGLWQAIHALYEAGERKGVQKSPVKDAFHPNQQFTVEGQYKQILLLSLADPMRLPQGDMERLALLLGPWAARCRLYPAGDQQVTEDACIVDLTADRAPAHLQYSGLAPHHQGCRLLDTAPLLQGLHRDLTQPPPAAFQDHGPALRRLPAAQLWQGMIRHLLIAWGTAPKRVFVRNDGGLAEMHLVAGLNGCHRLLSDEADNAPVEIPFAFGHRAPRSLSRNSTLQEELIVSAMIVNESANGICLRWLDALPGKIRVDEVLTLRHPPAEKWGVAVVRWLKTLGHRGLELGIELLDPEVIPVTVRQYDSAETEREYLKALYLPEVEALNQPASLLLPASFFQPDELISLKMGRQDHCLRLVEAVEGNRVYSRFLFSREG